eukprot:11858788-Alexandrium_andersonii.AAC.1
MAAYATYGIQAQQDILLRPTQLLLLPAALVPLLVLEAAFAACCFVARTEHEPFHMFAQTCIG